MKSTPLAYISTTVATVCRAADQITGNRNNYPLLVAAAVCKALQNYKIKSQILYGNAAWVEVLPNQQPIWAGCWGESKHVWVATEFGEIVDLNLSVSYRSRAKDTDADAAYCPPILWSKEIPAFLRYQMEGLAELDLDSDRDRDWLDRLLTRVDQSCIWSPDLAEKPFEELGFINEAILCPGKRILDDSNQTFRHYDRALQIMGVPPTPF
jgi:hypothetical protein